MTLDQYIATAASGGGFLAAFATLLTVWQIAKQRRATYRPDIVVKQRSVFAGTEAAAPADHASHDEVLVSLLKWNHAEDGYEDEFELLLVNIGLGAATDVSVTWDFPMVTFISALNMFAAECEWQQQLEYSNGMLSLPRRTSIWSNQQRGHFDYLLPASIEKEPTKLRLPPAYVWAVATHMSYFMRMLGQNPPPRRQPPVVPPLRLSLSFTDIAGRRHHQAYEIAFKWHMASKRSFRASLYPRKV